MASAASSSNERRPGAVQAAGAEDTTGSSDDEVDGAEVGGDGGCSWMSSLEESSGTGCSGCSWMSWILWLMVRIMWLASPGLCSSCSTQFARSESKPASSSDGIEVSGVGLGGDDGVGDC